MGYAWLVAIVCALAGAAPARAGTLTVTRTLCDAKWSRPYPCSYGDFTGAPGEANDLTLTGRPEDFTITDAGAPITAEGCEAVGPNAFHCTTSGAFRIDTGDGDDRVDADGWSYPIVLGAGDDRASGWVLDGGDGDDTLTGTAPAGTEGTLDGGAGADTILGGPGDEGIPMADDAAPDTVDGGGGTDSVGYSTRADPVTVDLGSPGAPQGAAGEDDRIAHVEGVFGGRGDDVLTGGATDDAIGGGEGDDRIDGGAGDDELQGDAGYDRVSGGDGDDRISSQRGARATGAREIGPETVDCGPGDDVVRGNDDILLPGCERLDLLGATMALYPAIATRLTFTLPCPRDRRRRGRCDGTLYVLGAPHRDFRLGRRGGRVRTRIPSPPYGAGRSYVEVRLTYRHWDGAGPIRFRYLIVLPAGR